MFFPLTAEESLAQLHSSLSGLDTSAVAVLRKKYGWNELPSKKTSVLGLFARQFNDVLVYILLGALVLTIALRLLEGGESSVEHSVDIIAILAILVLNAGLGFIQEYRADAELQSLQKLTAPQVRVRRMGGEFLLPSRELVPGDILIIEAGDRIAADGRLVSIAHLETDESSLTGESLPTHKQIEALRGNVPLAERTNMVFAGTLVTRGSGEYVVTAIASETEIGRIASLVREAKTPATPLELRMRHFSLIIGAGVLVLCAALAALQLGRGQSPAAVVLLAVSLAVSAVPEGLPAVVTASLAMGVRRMVKEHALVRRLDALETLGSVTVICSDKTGTITENRMKVVGTWMNKEAHDSASAEASPARDEAALMQAMSSCNRAQLPRLGDPTEVGLLEYAHEKGIERLPIDEEEVPFTSEAKYMQTRHGNRSFIKGAPETLAVLCALTSDHPMFAENERMAAKGLRILAAAVMETGSTPRLLGLVALEDPPREAVKLALAEALSAGIRTVMITGDSIDTARAIAARVGITGEAVEGRQVDQWSERELCSRVKTVGVYARVSPEHKIRICRALQKNGEIVAMTGDGVNDAPAIKAANIGISMGKNGTQVAREAASLILADDNYATIVAAIREGRRIYDNIRKFVLYLVQANLAQLMLITITVVLSLPLPLLPLHILWINLMTDGLPALALGMEKAEKGIMGRPPRHRREHLFAGDVGRLLLTSLIVCGLTLIVFLRSLNAFESIEQVRAITFTFSIIIEILVAFVSRSRRPAWAIGFFSNPWLIAAAAVPLLLQGFLLYTPLSNVFQITSLNFFHIAAVAGTAIAGYLLMEFSKQASRR